MLSATVDRRLDCAFMPDTPVRIEYEGATITIRLAKDLGPGHTIVTILADYGTRYQSKLFNPEFLRSRKLPVPEWLEQKLDLPNVFQ